MVWFMYVAWWRRFRRRLLKTAGRLRPLITLPLLINSACPRPSPMPPTAWAIAPNLVSTAVSCSEVLDWKYGDAAAPAVVGSFIGAQIAVELNEEMMRRAIGVVMVLMLFVILFKPDRWLKGHPQGSRRYPNLMELLIYFGLGIYGGFIQAGVGIFLLSGLVLASGYDLVRANAIKVLIILLVTAMAMVVFAANSMVRYEVGLILALGQTLGALAASRLAVKSGARFIRYLLIAVIVVSSLDLLGVFRLIGGLF